jgi:hypothetical protein
MEASGKFHAPAALSRGNSPSNPLDRRPGGPKSWSGLCGEEKIFHCRESNPGRQLVARRILYTNIYKFRIGNKTLKCFLLLIDPSLSVPQHT